MNPHSGQIGYVPWHIKKITNAEVEDGALADLHDPQHMATTGPGSITTGTGYSQGVLHVSSNPNHARTNFLGGSDGGHAR
jgi:hypothetical protein